MKVENMSKEINQYCTEIVEKYKIPGFAIGLEKDGELLWGKGYGYRDVEKELPMTSDTVVGIGSVTKSFTCVAIMQLQEAGKLSVHDPVVKYLPEFKTPDEAQTKQMTIHHFMTHTAGLPPLPTLLAALKNSIVNDPRLEGSEESAEEAELKKKIPSVETYEELFAYIAEQKYELLGVPGEEFSYSNDCYALLGTIVERVSGQTYEEYVKKNILEPCGMKNSVFHLRELDGHEDYATLYNSQVKDGETVVYESNNPWDAPSMRAAGFLKSTVKDMLKYAGIFSNGGKVGDSQVLSNESVEQMSTPFIECAPGRYYGYGLMITPDFFGYKLVEHGGAIKGVAAQMNTIPELGLTGMSLTNLGGVPSTKLLFSAFADYLGKSVTDTHIVFEEIEQSSDSLQEYEGEFLSGEGSKTRFHVKDEKLCISSEDFDSLELKSVGNDSFTLLFRESEIPIVFVKNEEGAIIRVALGFRQIPKVKSEVES
ncbi:serine hydrolase domain-containing protein [Psychrobacillus sp.]|uniref:serine hydrolase domain-containing protein n=1 Tax=Psychrobacillus sp. TaxID=1871623 RepID=UPI0028BEFE71|nr:serine hydrolase domain-containing protein [Psychrobacillus sp.]